MRAKYYWLEMHPSRGTCLLVVHVDCCLSEATCYGPAHSSSLLRSSHHHHININFFLAMVLLKHYFLDVTQKPLSRKRFLWKLLGFSLQTLHFSVDRKSWTTQARHSVYRSNMNIRHIPLVEQELFLHYLNTQVRSQTLKFSGILVVNGSVLWCPLYMIST
jgi:hypothetical protein